MQRERNPKRAKGTSMKFGIAGNQRCLTILNHSSQNLYENSKKSHLSSPWFSKKLRCLIRRKKNNYSKERKHLETLTTGGPTAQLETKQPQQSAEQKRRHFQKQASVLADSNYTPSKWWRVARDLCGLKGSASTCLPPLLDSAGDIVSETKAKANLLNDVFVH